MIDRTFAGRLPVVGREAAAQRIGAQLDSLPARFVHFWLVIGVCGAGFVDFYDLTMGGAIAGTLLRDGWSTLFLNSVFFSVAGLGAAAGVFSAGFIADRFGRIRTLQIALLVMVVGTLFCASAPTMSWLIAARLLAAVGMGAVPTVGFVYLAEVLPARTRGSWISGGAVVMGLASPVGSLSAYYLLPLGAWRWMFIVPSIAAVLLVMILGFFPESPRWLAVRGRSDEALLALRRIGGAHLEHASVEVGKPAGRLLPTTRRGAASLFRAPLLRGLLLAASLATAANVTTNGFIAWLPTLLLKTGTLSQGLGQNFLISLGAPLGGVLGFVFADRFGRKAGLTGSSLLACVIALACAVAPQSGGLVPLAFTLMAVISLVGTLILGVYVAECFPTPLRARGSALALTASRLAMIVAPFLIGALLQAHGRVGVMAFLASCMASVAVLVRVLGSETAGKSLSDA